VLADARKAQESGSTRFCMGAAWPRVMDGRAFDRVCDMVKGVTDMGLEACCTLGMLTEAQAVKLKDAGLTAYNHNLDTSEEFYDKIITTRTYKDRLDTIANVSKAGISLCCGGILGMGESQGDRIALLHRLANLNPQPESVPINMLVPVDGTPLEGVQTLDIFEWIRCIAAARILMPKAMVRLSAGRLQISREAQAMAFMAGANAIFTGEKLLTTANPEFDADNELLKDLGLTPRAPYKREKQKAA
jgi:biotin synthase